ncbi:MAG: transcription antiterminator [Lachnospiraceae bacterium]|jgi:activator of the mannose operon (transcriptional antiterminator)|nr:transcription antiterminator [Lachnospiraceae bacterium]
MKAVKKNILLHDMLLLLTENESISTARMASILGTSESTIRRHIDDVKRALEDAGYGTVLKIPGKGLSLIVREGKNQDIATLFSNYEIRSIATEEQQLYRYLFILLSLRSEKLTLYQLGERLYDSIPVVRKKLAVCEEWLSLFGLHLSIRRNYGVCLEGSEESRRLAIKHIVLGNDLYDIDKSIQVFAPGVDLKLLKRCITDIERQWNFKFTEESFHAMLIYAALSVTRSGKYELGLSKEERQTVYKYNEYNWARSLFALIDQRFQSAVGEDEIVFLAIQLLCSGLIHDQPDEENSVHTYDKKLKEFIRRIIAVISEVLDMDLTQDEELYCGLLNHIRPAIFRMRFEKHSTKTLTDFIREEYKETYRVSWTLSMLFEEYYGINISSTELSYITLYIQSSLERMQRPVRMAFVTELGTGLNQMFCNKIRMAIPKVETIRIVSLREFDRALLDEYDLIVTTSALNVNSPGIVQISSLLNESGIALINQRIKQLNRREREGRKRFDVSCHSLFDPRLIFTDLEVKDKTQLIDLLSRELIRQGYVTEKYPETIRKREKTVSTCIGNGVAIPHGNANYVNDSKVAIAFLKKKIPWSGEDEVDMVFLLAFRIENADSSRRVQLFYQAFLELIKTDENLRYLRGLTAGELYKYLVQ